MKTFLVCQALMGKQKSQLALASLIAFNMN